MKVFLALVGGFWFVYGLYSSFSLDILSQHVGIVATTAMAEVELRAMYGGAEMAIGLTALIALFVPRWLPTALFVQVVLLLGLGSVRAIAAINFGDASAYTLSALVFEFGTALVALYFLRGLSAVDAKS